MSDGLLLRDCLLTHQPTFLMMAGSDPSTIDTLPQPLQRIVADMHAVLHVVFEERRKFDDVTSIERRRLLVALGRISGGRTTSETKVVAGAHRAREILDSLADEFVLSDVRHQYGSDGSHSDAQTFVTALTAFYPDWAFGLGEVVQLDRHGPILALRSVNARFILMTSVWMASYLADEQVQDRDVQVIRAFLENTVFRTPPRGSVHTQPMHVRFDPQRGGVFAEFDETSGSNTVVFKMLPRFIYNEELDRYIRVHLEFRELKSSASAMRKRLMGRGVGDDVAFRIIVHSKEDWSVVRSVLEQHMCSSKRGARPSIIDGVRIGGARNGESFEDAGVLWKGVVHIPGVTECAVELQVVLFQTWWNRNHAFGAASDAWYKFKQWCKVPSDQPIGVTPLPPPIHLAFPPTVYPEWTDWEYLVRVLRERMLRKAIAICQTHDQLMAASAYIEGVIGVFAEHPWRFKFVEPLVAGL